MANRILKLLMAGVLGLPDWWRANGSGVVVMAILIALCLVGMAALLVSAARTRPPRRAPVRPGAPRSVFGQHSFDRHPST